MSRRRRPPRAGALSDLQPAKVATQIALVQTTFYASSLVLMLFTALVAGMPFGPDLVLGWEAVRGDTTRGWLLALVWLLDGGFVTAVAIVVLVARSKLVVDFAVTVHFLHLVFTTVYAGALPSHSMWWLAMASSSATAIALATWGCRYRELQPVFFGGQRVRAGGGEEDGRRAGEFELVHMKHGD
ncbi:SYS1-related integral membrane protein [Ophiocordyceps camponoti-floridani]|uniref:SYS1-related integral membrane protein n=1 Tax=Ophiocordyceps camponoti-floridani TaxID=2030778 RepID=A0A8H4QCN7_9HYPO|nr:SYS1-related integral membrane protein [Ophiocordyceps camponoti-floridani]